MISAKALLSLFLISCLVATAYSLEETNVEQQNPSFLQTKGFEISQVARTKDQFVSDKCIKACTDIGGYACGSISKACCTSKDYCSGTFVKSCLRPVHAFYC